MLEVIKKMDCHGYLLISTNVPHVRPSDLPLRVRWQIRSRLKKEGFMPFLTSWMIKPVYSKSEEAAIKKRLKSDNYELPVKLTFLYISKEDFQKFETVELKGTEYEL